MRGTSIFNLPAQLIVAARGTNQSESKSKQSSVWRRIQYGFFIWRVNRMGVQAIKDYKTGKCRTLRPEHFESLDNYLNLP